MSGKQEVTFPAVLQALCRHTSVLGESCLQGKLGSPTHIRDTVLPHCFSRAPHAELPTWNKTHSVPGGTAWPGVWGGSETIRGWQGRKTLNFKVSGNGMKASCTPGTGAIPKAEIVPHMQAVAQVVLGLPINLLPAPVSGTETKLCWVLLSFMWRGTKPSLPPTYGCAFFCFTALVLYGLQAFCSPENSCFCEDATRIPQVWRYPWAELPVEKEL